MAASQPRSVVGRKLLRLTRREDRSAQPGCGPENLVNRAAAGGQLIGSASSNVRLQTKLVAAAHQTGRLWPSRTRVSGECLVNQIVDGATAWLILLTS